MRIKNNDIIKKYSSMSLDEFTKKFDKTGLSDKKVGESLNKYGKNHDDIKDDSILIRIKRAFINPYSVVLMILGVVSLFTDIIFSENPNYTTVILVVLMLILAATIRFIEELRAKRVADRLNKFTNFQVSVRRNNEIILMDSKDILIGDVLILKAGDKVPCDLRIIESNGIYVSESAITGESKAIYKTANSSRGYSNIVFKDSSIITGCLEGVAIFFSSKNNKNNLSEYKRGYDEVANSIIWVLIKFMLVLIPIIFITVGLFKGNWIEALLFALSVAVGLTPELLPMVITASLAKGSASMREKKTIVKNINAMQSFGAMDILCVDKTGTLTEDKLKLEYYIDILGNESKKTLDFAYLSSYFTGEIENHIDSAILEIANNEYLKGKFSGATKNFFKLDEKPFDYVMGFSKVLLKNNEKNIIIAKGKVEEILKLVSKIEYKNIIYSLEENMKQDAYQIVDELLNDGIKVLALAYKDTKEERIDKAGNNDFILLGFLTFFDPPKKTAEQAILKLAGLNVKIKILTGDDDLVSKSISRRLGINSTNSMTGATFMNLNEDEKFLACENTDVFTELNPNDKECIVKILKDNGHTVGFLGDGLNDIKAIKKSNVGISVDTAPKVLKSVSDVVLLENDLNVLEGGILEGRKSFTNMNKYIKITASSNLGNILAIIIASIFLPFLPITALQILLLNLLYDIICLVLPWDNIDDDCYKKPISITGRGLTKFMLFFGPVSTIFDIITFIFLYFYLCPSLAGGSFNVINLEAQENFIMIFQTGWFLESMWTQILIIHLLRTKSLSLINGKPSKYVLLITILGALIYTGIVMMPIGRIIGLTQLPFIYFAFLALIILGYFITITIFKYFYIKKYKNLI